MNFFTLLTNASEGMFSGWWSGIIGAAISAGIVGYWGQKALGERDKAISILALNVTDLKQQNAALEGERDRLKETIDALSTSTIKHHVRRIATLGKSQTGKSLLSIRWVNPLTDPKTLAASKYDRFKKPISVVQNQAERTCDIYYFEILDWAGEYNEEVYDELHNDKEPVDALLLVVDVAAYDEGTKEHLFSPDRIKDQLQQWNFFALRPLLSPDIVRYCHHYVLFINKTDVLQKQHIGSDSNIGAYAERLYGDLIADLKKLAANKPIQVHVVTGSAMTGDGVLDLYSCMIRGILPDDARDEALKSVPRGAAETATNATALNAPKVIVNG